MAESVDALVSNTSGRKAVPVRPRLRVQKKQVEMPAFFVLSLAGTEQAPLVIPPPGPLRGGGGRYAPILQVEMPAFFVGMIVASLNIIFRPGVMLKGDMI